MNKKRIIQIIVSIVAFYLILMLLLFAVESIPKDNPSSIDSLGDAAWYVLATLTTVGYGDVTPVSFPGKVIGAIMMISSAGVLTFLLGLVFTVLFGRLLPTFTLWRYRKKDWYVFSSVDERSQLLAEGLSKDDPNAAYIFCGSEENLSQEHYPAMKYHVITDTPMEVVIKKQDPAGKCFLFLVTENKWENYNIGNSLLNKMNRENLKVYCEADHTPDRMSHALTVFNKPDCIARKYWNDNPLNMGESGIILIGDGKIAQKLLERGLLINVFPPEQTIEYHVFGDWDNFRHDHYELENIVGINGLLPDDDGIFFESKPWNASVELLRSASRIIICADDEDKNISVVEELKAFFPTKARIDVYTDGTDESFRSFGGDTGIFTREIVMHEKLNRVARMLNEIYRTKTRSGPAWNELTEFKRQSNIAAADHMLTKIRLLIPMDDIKEVTPETCMMAYEVYKSFTENQKDACRWLEHKRWVRFHVLNNWSYSPVRDNDMRQHTMIVPYEDLNTEEQLLDDMAWELLGEIT